MAGAGGHGRVCASLSPNDLAINQHRRKVTMGPFVTLALFHWTGAYRSRRPLLRGQSNLPLCRHNPRGGGTSYSLALTLGSDFVVCAGFLFL